jgi:hypothetical protein
MAIGPGRYDDVATHVRETTHAEGVILLVIGGDKGSGFSAQLSAIDTLRVPEILRSVADQIEQGGGEA